MTGCRQSQMIAAARSKKPAAVSHGSSGRLGRPLGWRRRRLSLLLFRRGQGGRIAHRSMASMALLVGSFSDANAPPGERP